MVPKSPLLSLLLLLLQILGYLQSFRLFRPPETFLRSYPNIRVDRLRENQISIRRKATVSNSGDQDAADALVADESLVSRINITAAKEAARDVLASIMKHRHSMSASDVLNANVDLLTANARLLTRFRMYEDIMEEIYLTCNTSDDTAAVRSVDDMLRSFVLTERKKRSRMKVKYLLLGAAADKLSYTLERLRLAYVYK